MKAKQAFEFNIDRSKRLISLYSTLKDMTDQHSRLADLLRAAYVLAVGALDAYVHDKVSENIVVAIKTAIKNSNQAQLSLIDKYVARERKLTIVDMIKAATNKRPFVPIRAHIDKALYKDTFQNPGTIEDAFQLLGVANLWSAVSNALGEDIGTTKAAIASFSIRRNQIVHEGDREKSRKRKHKYRRISKDTVASVVSRIASIVEEIDSVVDSQRSASKQTTQ